MLGADIYIPFGEIFKLILSVLSFLMAIPAASHRRLYPHLIYLSAYIRYIVSCIKSYILYVKSEFFYLCLKSCYIRLYIIYISRCYEYICYYVVFTVYCSVIEIKEALGLAVSVHKTAVGICSACFYCLHFSTVGRCSALAVIVKVVFFFFLTVFLHFVSVEFERLLTVSCSVFIYGFV